MGGDSALTFRCQTCGDSHDLNDIGSMGFGPPPVRGDLSDADQARSELTEGTCVTRTDDEVNFFVRGLISIPIKDKDGVFSWDVWCSVSETSYADIIIHHSDPQRTGLGPYFGWLMTNVPGYPQTFC